MLHVPARKGPARLGKYVQGLEQTMSRKEFHTPCPRSSCSLFHTIKLVKAGKGISCS